MEDISEIRNFSRFISSSVNNESGIIAVYPKLKMALRAQSACSMLEFGFIDFLETSVRQIRLDVPD